LTVVYWWLARKFVAGDQEALAGMVASPVPAPLFIRHVTVWDGTGTPPQRDRSVLIRDGRIASIGPATTAAPADAMVIDGTGKTLIPGLIDSHVHLMYDSGPDLLTRGRQLMDEWMDRTGRYPDGREPIVRRGHLKLKAGVTTMRVLGDGLYALRYRDDVARWDVVGPRVLAAGLHVNGPAGYVSGGVAAHLDDAWRARAALELTSLEEIEPKLTAHIARGVDVIKIATTHGDLGFHDAKPDLPEAWVREIVRVAHAHGRPVTAHSYGEEGDWAAIRGGVDGIEHLVNVPHELSDSMVAAVRERGIVVCPTLAGSAYSVVTLLRDPGRLHRDPDLIANVPAAVRKDLYFAIRLLKLPGVARILMRESEPMRRWELWYRHSIANTAKLHGAGVRLIFGTDTPFAFGNFHHSVMNEVRGLREAGIPAEAILRMATSDAARALGIAAQVGTVEPRKTADLVLLDGDPLQDIEALGRVTVVIKEGRVVYRR
jgi:imidazolonepropionase-like amidohydrolase